MPGLPDRQLRAEEVAVPGLPDRACELCDTQGVVASQARASRACTALHIWRGPCAPPSCSRGLW